VIVLFGTLALFLSQILPSRRLAAMTTGLVVVASYFITSLARIDENLEAVARLSPLNYYQSGEAINGLDWGWLGGLFGVAMLFTMLAWWRFQKRDLRVGGEGSWNLRLRRKIHTQAKMSS
jgi:ABC-2 type transport system permease protein